VTGFACAAIAGVDVYSLSEVETLAVGLLALVVAELIFRHVPVLARINVPVPVVGGLLVAVVVALLYRTAQLSIQFTGGLTDFFLLVFFTTVGLSARFSALKAGGRPLVILCVATVLLLVAQNVVGISIAWLSGAHPQYGLLIGSISFVGGPGTAAAWAKEAQAAGLERAPEVAVGAATFAVIVGALVAGPITGWLVRRRGLRGPQGESAASWVAPAESSSVAATSVPRTFQVWLLIVMAVLAGATVNAWARRAGLVLPGFLTAMLVGVAIANFLDMCGRKLDMYPIERAGQLALQAFLAMYLMSLKLWTLGAVIGLLAIDVLLQVLVASIIGMLLLFRWLGRDYDAAVTVGGFLGFGLSSMPVAMATMDSVASRYGPSPKAFLIVTLAGSFFVDLANAFIVKGFLMIPGIR
jgi:ESS family glutamate:Na+ symporter